MPTTTPMQITREDLNPCTVKLTVVCDPDAVRDGFDRAFKHEAKRVRLDGFRPGQAPKKLVEKYLTDEMLKDTAADMIVRAHYKKAMEAEQLKPYRTPRVTVMALERQDNKCEFELLVPLEPQVKVGSLEGIKLEHPPIEVTDQEVTDQIDEFRKRKSKRESVTDRGAQEGDYAVVNVRLDGEEGDGRNFMVVVGQTFKDLDEALVGLKADDVKHLTLRFPANFGEKDWAGKEHSCQLLLRSVSTMQLPELDEAFAKEMSFENVDELRDRVKAAIERAKQSAAQDYLDEQVMEQLLQRSEVHVPDTVWEDVAEERLSYLATEFQQKGISAEDYAKENGMTVEQLVDAIRQEAKTQVLRAQLVNEVFKVNNLQVTNDDMNRVLVRMAAEADMTPAKYVEALKANKSLQQVTHQAIHRKVLDHLRAQVEGEPVGAAKE